LKDKVIKNQIRDSKRLNIVICPEKEKGQYAELKRRAEGRKEWQKLKSSGSKYICFLADCLKKKRN